MSLWLFSVQQRELLVAGVIRQLANELDLCIYVSLKEMIRNFVTLNQSLPELERKLAKLKRSVKQSTDDSVTILWHEKRIFESICECNSNDAEMLSVFSAVNRSWKRQTLLTPDSNMQTFLCNATEIAIAIDNTDVFRAINNCHKAFLTQTAQRHILLDWLKSSLENNAFECSNVILSFYSDTFASFSASSFINRKFNHSTPESIFLGQLFRSLISSNSATAVKWMTDNRIHKPTEDDEELAQQLNNDVWLSVFKAKRESMNGACNNTIACDADLDGNNIDWDDWQMEDEMVDMSWADDEEGNDDDIEIEDADADADEDDEDEGEDEDEHEDEYVHLLQI